MRDITKFEEQMDQEIKAVVHSNWNSHAKHMIGNLENIIISAEDLLGTEHEREAKRIIATYHQALSEYINLLQTFPKFRSIELTRKNSFRVPKYFSKFISSSGEYSLEYVALAKKDLLNKII